MALYEELADKTADAYAIPRSLFRALIQQESGWNPYAVGKAGEIGLTQLMPTTANDLGVNAWNPDENLKGGAAYLKAQFTKFGDWAKALAAYNGGPGGVDLPQAKEYATDIINTQRELQKANPALDKTVISTTTPDQDWYHGSVLEQIIGWLGGPDPTPSGLPPQPEPQKDQYGLPIPTPEQTNSFADAAGTVGKYVGATALVIVSISIALFVLAWRGKDAAIGAAKKTVT